ncbi:uncharacterized protein [Petaurus breviceps papuanus]|uniref:uncharacterized protein n=1 Tax=Petaurus breviceps papuanus TaxID=3040969 RepID=UPI0036D8E6D7
MRLETLKKQAESHSEATCGTAVSDREARCQHTEIPERGGAFSAFEHQERATQSENNLYVFSESVVYVHPRKELPDSRNKVTRLERYWVLLRVLTPPPTLRRRLGLRCLAFVCGRDPTVNPGVEMNSLLPRLRAGGRLQVLAGSAGVLRGGPCSSSPSSGGTAPSSPLLLARPEAASLFSPESLLLRCRRPPCPPTCPGFVRALTLCSSETTDRSARIFLETKEGMATGKKEHLQSCSSLPPLPRELLFPPLCPERRSVPGRPFLQRL